MKNIAITLWLSLLMVLSLQGEPWNIFKVGEVVTDSYIGVLGNGEVAYATSPYGLLVIDVSDRAEPRLIQRIETDGTAGEMALKDTLLFLCDGYAGLKTYNVIDPREPSLISTCSEVPGASRVKIRDDLAFISAEGSGFYTVDISDPLNPEGIGSHQRNADDIALNGDYAYTSGGYVGIFNISNPTNPEYLRNLDEQIGGEIYCHEGVLFSPTRWFSLADPDNPSLIFNRGLLGNSSGCIALNDHYCWIPGSEHDGEIRGPGLFCYDISDPSNPERVGGCAISIAIPMAGANLDYDNGTIYLARREYGLSVVDADDPTEPREVTVLDANPAAFTDVAVMDGWVYAVDKTGRLVTYSLENPSRPELTDAMIWNTYYFSGGEPWLLEIFDGYLYELTNIAYYQRENGGRVVRTGLYIYSLEDPSHPDSVGLLDNDRPVATIDIAIDDNVLYMASSQDSLVAISLADPTNPHIVGRGQYHYRGYIGIDAEGDIVVVTAYSDDLDWKGIVIFDKSDPTNLVRLSELNLGDFNSGFSYDVALFDDYAYVLRRQQLIIASLENPSEPEVLRVIDLNYAPGMMKIHSDRLYLRSSLGILIYSLEDPLNPVLAGHYDTPDVARDFDFAGDYLVVADGTDLGIYDARRAQGAWYLDISVDSHDFGEVYLDSIAEWELTIRNLSEHEREITDITTDNDAFACRFDGSFALTANLDTTFIISFTPIADTSYACILNVVSGEYSIEVPLSGRGIRIDAVVEEPDMVYDFNLWSTYPNPFNSETSIHYSLPSHSDVDLSIFDLYGRRIRTLVNEPLQAGYHTTIWDGRNEAGIPVSSGLYFYRINAGNFTKVRKMTMVK